MQMVPVLLNCVFITIFGRANNALGRTILVTRLNPPDVVICREKKYPIFKRDVI